MEAEVDPVDTEDISSVSTALSNLSFEQNEFASLELEEALKTNAILVEQLNAFKMAGAANHPSAMSSPNNNTFSILNHHRITKLNATAVQALIVSRNELTQAGQVKPITDQMDESIIAMLHLYMEGTSQMPLMEFVKYLNANEKAVLAFLRKYIPATELVCKTDLMTATCNVSLILKPGQPDGPMLFTTLVSAVLERYNTNWSAIPHELQQTIYTYWKKHLIQGQKHLTPVQIILYQNALFSKFQSIHEIVRKLFEEWNTDHELHCRAIERGFNITPYVAKTSDDSPDESSNKKSGKDKSKKSADKRGSTKTNSTNCRRCNNIPINQLSQWFKKHGTCVLPSTDGSGARCIFWDHPDCNKDRKLEWAQSKVGKLYSGLKRSLISPESKLSPNQQSFVTFQYVPTSKPVSTNNLNILLSRNNITSSYENCTVIWGFHPNWGFSLILLTLFFNYTTYNIVPIDKNAVRQT